MAAKCFIFLFDEMRQKRIFHKFRLSPGKYAWVHRRFSLDVRWYWWALCACIIWHFDSYTVNVCKIFVRWLFFVCMKMRLQRFILHRSNFFKFKILNVEFETPNCPTFVLNVVLWGIALDSIWRWANQFFSNSAFSNLFLWSLFFFF